MKEFKIHSLRGVSILRMLSATREYADLGNEPVQIWMEGEVMREDGRRRRTSSATSTSAPERIRLATRPASPRAAASSSAPPPMRLCHHWNKK
ncbi:unnamed protein product [Euphydryas editha]|uniref:Uncharacterized protein n=1 Tax=Euphydryas editha TaxID=104508 RepID=A0AAU9U0B1_EUPED|nr:unnamed protein product [Euphydryas editha]